MLLVLERRILEAVPDDNQIGVADVNAGIWRDDKGRPIGPIPQDLPERRRPADGQRYLLTTGLVPTRVPDGAKLLEDESAEAEWRTLLEPYDAALQEHGVRTRFLKQLADAGVDRDPDSAGDPPTRPERFLGSRGLRKTDPGPARAR